MGGRGLFENWIYRGYVKKFYQKIKKFRMKNII